MNQALEFTQADNHFLGTLPPEVRDEVCAWRDALLMVTPPLKHSLARVAAQIGVSTKTARRKYDVWRHSGFSLRSLVNKAKVPEIESALTPEFLEWFKALAESNQRKTKPAYRKFCALWKSGAQIPGMDNSLPRHSVPPGFGYDNINKRTQDIFAKLAMRRGLGVAMAKCGPQIFSTRANLWLMSHVPIDDLWHDNFVVFSGKSGARAQIVRVLELDAMDVFTGKLLAFGCKPRFQRADGTMDGLKEKYASLLLTDVFLNTGYSPRGTFVMAEHGTGAVPERVAKVLYDYSGKLIRLRESGMTQEEQVICGQYGRGRGNPRFKAALEAMRNLKHNELAWVTGQTGKDRDHRPEFTHGQLEDCADMLKAMAVLSVKHPERARALKLNLMDYHADFLPLLMDVYREINNRDWHELEGWARIPGNIAIDYRTTPSSEHWLTDAEFSNLPTTSKQILIAAANEDRSYLRSRRLSPAQAWDAHYPQDGLLKLPPFVAVELLGDDFAREQKVAGAYFETFEDMEFAPEPLRYESVITTPDGKREQLRDGKYEVFVNPFNLSQLFVRNASKVCLGIAARVERVDQGSDEQLKRAFGYRAHRLAELQKPILARHAQTVREDTARAAHNARVLDTRKPFTEGEIAEAEFVREVGPEAAQDILAPSETAREDARPTDPDAGDELLNIISEQTR